MKMNRSKCDESAYSPAYGPARALTILRGALIGAAFLTLLITGLFTRSVDASSLQATQNTIPPGLDSVGYSLFLPQLATPDDGGHTDDIDDDLEGKCPTESIAVYKSVLVDGPSADRPPPIHGDLNLSLRSYITATAPLTLVDINGPTDPDAPQMAGVVGTGRPDFVAAYQVNDWDWGCQGDDSMPWYGHGCRGDPIAYPPVTLLAMATEPGTPVLTPSRNPEIYGGGYVALVLYAEERRLTLAYTREDTAAHGYVIHLEDFCVDPALLQLYRELDSAGRSWLPALQSLQQVGTGADTPLKTAIRDTGSFMDPRSRKDWWKGY